MQANQQPESLTLPSGMVVLHNFASSNLTPVTLAPFKFAPLRLAVVKMAPVRLESLRLVSRKYALEKFVNKKSTLLSEQSSIDDESSILPEGN